MTTAYSYLRFSSPQQSTGDSIRRQTEATARWCRENKVKLDTSISLRDDGVSAFKGKHRENADTHALASFVAAVKSGRVATGSYLIVESLDRLTREKIRPALTLLLNLIESGIKVVQLIPAMAVYDEDVEPMQLMMAVMELNRGHSESAVKSKRVGAAWKKKQENAATELVTKRVPGWIDHVDGKLLLNEKKAAVVRRIFAATIAGTGLKDIARALNAERVPVFGRLAYRGRKVEWSTTAVYQVLISRATVGEYVPYAFRTTGRPPKGEPVSGYFPAAIDEKTWDAARGVSKRRGKVGRGRRGKHVNLFAGLLTDARDGGTLSYWHPGGRPASIISFGAKEGRGASWVSFPAAKFESGLVSQLAEVTAVDVLPGSADGTPVEALAGRITETDELIKLWTGNMDDPTIVNVVAAKLAELTNRRRVLAEELATAREEAASPLSETWGEFRSLAGLLETDTSDETRLKVRSALRRTVESVYCLIVPYNKAFKSAVVQVHFAGAANFRCYFLTHRRGKPIEVWSAVWSATGFDIRTPEGRAMAEKIATGMAKPA